MANTHVSRYLLMALATISMLCSLTPVVAQPATEKSKRSSATSQPSQADLQSLREENQRLRKELDALKAVVARLQKRIEARGVAKLMPGSGIEYGSVLFEKGRKQHGKKIIFRNTYKSPPIVLVCESGTSGTWVLVKSERITTAQAEIAVQGKFDYPCRVAYAVIGETEDVAPRPRQPDSQVEPADPPKPQASNAQQRIAWPQYRQDCGIKAQEVNQARTEEVFRTKYKGKTISWQGTVVGVREGFFGGAYSVDVRMEPSESLRSDLTLSVPTQFKDIVLSLSKGSIIRFDGSIVQQGGAFLDHMIDVTRLEKK